MILYTMLPYELVFPCDSDLYNKQHTIIWNGIPLLVEQADPQTVQVVRILSSDPQHFLDDRLIPGTKISLFKIEGLS